MKHFIFTYLFIFLSTAHIFAEDISRHNISNGPLFITEGGTYLVTGDNNNEDDCHITINVSNGQPVNLILEDIYIYTEQTHPLEIQNGSVALTLRKNNQLENNQKCPIQVAGSSTLTIDGPGSLRIGAGYSSINIGDESRPTVPTNVTIQGGIIIADFGTSAPLSITGGSVMGNFIEKDGKQRVTAIFFDQNGPLTNETVTFLFSPEGYGSTGLETDASNKIYFWLPEGQQNISLSLEGNDQKLTGSINVSAGSENELNLIPEGSHFVTYKSNSSTFSLRKFPAAVLPGETFTFSTVTKNKLQILSATASNAEIQPTGKPHEYSFIMPDQDVEIQIKASDLKVITDVADGTEYTDQNILLIKKAGAYIITRHERYDDAYSQIRIADDVTGDVTVTFRDLNIQNYTGLNPIFDCGKGSQKTTLILEGENIFYSTDDSTIPDVLKSTNGSLVIDGTGTLLIKTSKQYPIGNPDGDTGNITIAGGSLTINSNHLDASAFSTGNNITLTGGSILATIQKYQELTSIGLTDNRHLVTATLENTDQNTIISSFTAGGQPYGLKGMSPDEEGKLYLWLPEGQQTLTLLTNENITYTGTVDVKPQTNNLSILTPEEGVHSITISFNDKYLSDYIHVAKTGKPGERIWIRTETRETIRCFLQYTTIPGNLAITSSPDDPSLYSFIMPDQDVTLIPQPVAFDVETDTPDGYQVSDKIDNYSLLITRPGTYKIKNKAGLPNVYMSIWVVNPELLESEDIVDPEPFGPVTIILDGVDINTGKLPTLLNISSTQVNIQLAEGTTNKLSADDAPAIYNMNGVLNLQGSGRLKLYGKGQTDVIFAYPNASVSIESSVEITNQDEDGHNKSKYGISTLSGFTFDLPIKSGTIIADYIGDSSGNSDAKKVIITGGSIHCKELRNPVNEADTPLLETIVTLPSSVNGETTITNWSGLGYYSLKNTYTDNEGKLYLWLPEGQTYANVCINNAVGSITAGQAVTLTPDETAPQINVSTNNLDFTITVTNEADGSLLDKVTLDNESIMLDINGTYSATGTAGTHTIVATDLAGNRSEATFTLESTPAPVYFTVDIPKVKGAVTNPPSGFYTVAEGANFYLTVTLEKDYDQSVPIVTLTDGETLYPNSQGEYVINKITTDQQVFITGIEKNPDPTSNATVENNHFSVETGIGCLWVRVSCPTTLYIFSPNGKTVHQQKVSAGETRIDGLKAGLYLVRPDLQKGKKVIIK